MNIKKKIRDLCIGKKIKNLRIEQGLTQGKLAEMVGGDTRQISLYESNKNTPSTEILVRLSKALGVSVDYLLKDEAQRVLIPQVYDQELLKQVETIDKFNDNTKDAVKLILNALIIEHQLGGLIKPTLARQNLKK